MKIYNRKEFMKLPAGVIFSSGPAFAFSDLYIKGESLSCDFYQSNLMGIESFNSEENADRFYAMEGDGASYPINKSECREGLFDDNFIYLVYESEDLQYLIEKFQEALKLVAPSKPPTSAECPSVSCSQADSQQCHREDGQ